MKCNGKPGTDATRSKHVFVVRCLTFEIGTPVARLSSRSKLDEERTPASSKASCESCQVLSSEALRLSVTSKSVGGAGADDTHTAQSQEDKLAELSAFDQKIYLAQVRMNQAMDAELKGLGVPFFGTPSDCVRYGQSDCKTNNDTLEVRPKWSPRVTPEELQDLQRRMIKYLEDMYKD